MAKNNPDNGIIEIMDANLRQGFAQVPRPVLRAKSLSIKAKIVYIALLDYAWQQGSCYPGQVRLADDLSISVDTVQRALAELKRFGLVDWKQRGLKQTNVYRLLPLGENPYLFPADPGNRNLRLQETAVSGTTNTQKEKYSGDLSIIDRSPEDKKAPTTNRGFDDRRVPPTAVAALRQQATASIGRGSSVSEEAAAEEHPRPRRRGRARGSTDAREQLGAYLTDFAQELGDEAALSATITRAFNIFAAAKIPPGRWGDYLYQARAITQEHTVQITKRATDGDDGIRQKNKMPYYFGVLEQLVGLRPDLSKQSGMPE